MQSGRNTVESAKESAAASAKAAMERAKATAKEKVFIYFFLIINPTALRNDVTYKRNLMQGEKLTTRDPMEKEAATLGKEQRKTHAELNKEEAKAHNEAARRLGETGGPHPGYETRGTEGQEYRTTTATDTAPATGHEGYAADSRYPRGRNPPSYSLLVFCI
ncbi:hypothetical protein WN944_004607 [Citrus x changshan-huyou]|uniref:Uncharacterized protein n=1 Tax=Citrus x changshan-huyou TaxID=2935761 RepID=A0AAP0QMA4_9ROSI